MARSLQDWIGNSGSSDNSQSLIARLGGFGQQYTDPLYWIFGDKYTDKLIGLADKSNDFLSKSIFKPIGKYAGQFDPIRQNSGTADQIGDWGESKPVDTLAMLAGAYFGGGALAGGGSGGGGGAAGGLGTGGAAAPAGMTTAGFMPGSAAGAGLEGVTVLGSAGGAAMSPGTAAAMAAAGAGGGAAAGQQGTNWRDMLDNMPNQQQQQQGQPQQQQPVGARPQTMIEKIKRGLGQTGERMFPVDKAYGLDQQQQQAMRKNALLQMGLGMMSASGQGAGFGEAAAFGLGKAQQNLTGALQQGYENARTNRLEQRQTQRDEVADKRWQSELDYREAQDKAQLEQRKLEQEAMATYRSDMLSERKQQEATQAEYRKDMLDLRRLQIEAKGKAPNGYRWKEDGGLEPIKGGPADPSNKTGNYQEAERTAAFLGTRLGNALKALKDIPVEDQVPGVMESAARGAGSEIGANLLRNENRQKANAAQLDALDAALTLATGAAYTKEQLEGQKVSYFPQIGDSDTTKEMKAQKLEDLFQAARIKAGRASSAIDAAMKGRGATGKWLIEEE